MVKFTNNCIVWWNSQTIAQHGEMHKQLNNRKCWIALLNFDKESFVKDATATVRTPVLVSYILLNQIDMAAIIG